MLLIGVHYPQRELIPKLLLAHKATQRYGSAVIGRTSSIRKVGGQVFQHSFGPFSWRKRIVDGVVLEVAITPEASTQGRLPDFLENGFRVASFDEEATAFWDPSLFAKKRIDTISADLVEVLFSWGDWHDTAIKYSDISLGKVARVGSPRFEVYQTQFDPLFQDEVEFIRNRFGRFVLINTNIVEMDWSEASFKKRVGELEEKQRRVGRDVDAAFGTNLMKEKSQLRRAAFASQIAISNRFTELLEETSGEHVHVVMRPKPSVAPEKLERYAKSLGFRGIVDGRFSVVPWIKSCEAVLQHGCTTSLEAALVNTPAVMFGSDQFVAEPVKQASFLAETVEEAAHALVRSCGPGYDPQHLKKRYMAVSGWHQNIGGSASDAVLDELQERGLVGGEKRLNYGGTLGAKSRRARSFDRNTPVYDPAKRGIDQRISFQEVSKTLGVLDEVFGFATATKQIDKEVFLIEGI